VRERVDFAIQRMREQGETRGVIDVFQWWMFMTTDVIGESSQCVDGTGYPDRKKRNRTYRQIPTSGQLTFGESFRTLEKAQVSHHSYEPTHRN